MAGWQLFYYAFAAEEDLLSLALFCPGNQINSNFNLNAEYQWASDDFKETDIVPYADYNPIEYASLNIAVGEEIVVDYGGLEWFNSRNVSYDEYEKTNYTLADLEVAGHCLTDIFVEDSPIPMAGKGVFTKKAHKKGDVVSISPALVLPKHTVYTTNDTSLLINYCICSNGSDVALVPIGLAGVMNHGGSSANVAMDWMVWEGMESRLSWDVQDLESAPFAPLDIQVIATRDIKKGEEILLHYGVEWEEEWTEYVHAMMEWNSNHGHGLQPQFRHHIGAPAGFFPASFVSDCIGDDCSGVDNGSGNGAAPEAEGAEGAHTDGDIATQMKNSLSNAVDYVQNQLKFLSSSQPIKNVANEL
jgi:hypothetical protein